MTEIAVNSTICGFVHKISGNRKGNKIIVDIETPCEKIKEISHLEIPMTEILDIKNNYVIDRAQEAKCCSNCLVPCAVLNLCRLESGFLAKSLAKKQAASASNSRMFETYIDFTIAYSGGLSFYWVGLTQLTTFQATFKFLCFYFFYIKISTNDFFHKISYEYKQW